MAVSSVMPYATLGSWCRLVGVGSPRVVAPVLDEEELARELDEYEGAYDVDVVVVVVVPYVVVEVVVVVVEYREMGALSSPSTNGRGLGR